MTRGLVAGLLVASIAVVPVASESEVICVPDDELSQCASEALEDMQLEATEQDRAVAPAELVPMDVDVATTTRVIGPPVMVNPFSDTAPTVQIDQPATPRLRPSTRPHLPPGPPSRLP